tara:strand:- start:27739 stop:27999 length:261 start_codon:yes stop_codon:yes gene_type:complete
MIKEYKNYIIIAFVALSFFVGYKFVLAVITGLCGLFAISQEREFRKIERDIEEYDERVKVLREEANKKIKKEEVQTKEEIDSWLDQ